VIEGQILLEDMQKGEAERPKELPEAGRRWRENKGIGLLSLAEHLHFWNFWGKALTRPT